MVHIDRCRRSEVRPQVVVFDEPTRLLSWAIEQEVSRAIVGGFYLRKENKPLGDLWAGGVAQPSIPFAAPWGQVRGSVYIDHMGELHLGSRRDFPTSPEGDLIQAGPLLVCNGTVLLDNHTDTEGFSAAAHQFDTDISIGRYPRAAIGVDDTYIWLVTCDGRTELDAGLTLTELARLMKGLGSTEALNLDGGSSASLVSDGKLLNTPRGDGITYFAGRNIHTAIAFMPQG